MPRFEKDGVAVETAIPREAAELRSQGFKESKAKTAAVKAAEAEAKPAKASTETSK
ncbi:hypothetical protein [Arthrobacter sp. USHLN218]|uniref:hypothetical protein n=1 Tax=Arthrobacter sp. USHLN218 TaxID=3081232 RepID=UPI0030165FA2